MTIFAIKIQGRSLFRIGLACMTYRVAGRGTFSFIKTLWIPPKIRFRRSKLLNTVPLVNISALQGYKKGSSSAWMIWIVMIPPNFARFPRKIRITCNISPNTRTTLTEEARPKKKDMRMIAKNWRDRDEGLPISASRSKISFPRGERWASKMCPTRSLKNPWRIYPQMLSSYALTQIAREGDEKYPQESLRCPQCACLRGHFRKRTKMCCPHWNDKHSREKVISTLGTHHWEETAARRTGIQLPAEA